MKTEDLILLGLAGAGLYLLTKSQSAGTLSSASAAAIAAATAQQNAATQAAAAAAAAAAKAQGATDAAIIAAAGQGLAALLQLIKSYTGGGSTSTGAARGDGTSPNDWASAAGKPVTADNSYDPGVYDDNYVADPYTGTGQTYTDTNSNDYL